MNSTELQADRERYVARGMFSASSGFAQRAEGVKLWDVDGREYIDFATGISVLNVGHRHPRVQAAIHEQLDQLVHSGAPVMMPVGYVELARRLCEVTPGSFEKKALFVNSGAEAVENAVKVVRKATGRSVILSFQSGFHGRTLLTMSLSGKAHPYRQHFGPYASAIHHLPFPDPYRRPAGLTVAGWTDLCLQAAETTLLTDADTHDVAGVLVEPIQGEGGFVVPPADFLPRLANLCKDQDIPLIVDEVQTGFGRTGKMFAVEHYGVEPDLLVVAKSLGGGLPLAGVVGRAALMDATDPGGLGGTFGGNPVACAAALAVIDVIEDERLCDRANQIGELSLGRMREWQQRYPAVGDVRGVGAMVAMELVQDRTTREPAKAVTAAIIKSCHRNGLLLLSAGLYDNVVRLLPPLVTTEDELAQALDILENVLGEVLRTEA